MRTGSNLKRRGATYYARQVVPIELQQLMVKRELVSSLHTSDRRTASVRKLDVLAEWHRRFDDLRRRHDLTEADFATATRQHYIEELRLDAADRALPDHNASFATFSRQHQLRALREHLGRGETALIEWAANAYIQRERLLVERGTLH